MIYHYLLKHPALFQYAIGIPYSKFLTLLPKFRKALREAEYEKAWKKIRIRLPGGGRKATLTTDEENLFFILLYYKVYPTFRFAQAIFGFDKRNIQLWKNFLVQVLSKIVVYKLILRKISSRTSSFEAWVEEYPQLKEFLVDTTERWIQRPKDNKIQEFYYSGKKKKHTVKTPHSPHQVLIA
jgi:hypothetical protein